MPRVVGTVVLTITLLVLQAALWYIRPHPAEKALPLYHYAAVNVHGGNRKLLVDVNFSRDSNETSSSGRDVHLGTTNDKQQVS